jgi:hypothetical protein
MSNSQRQTDSPVSVANSEHSSRPNKRKRKGTPTRHLEVKILNPCKKNDQYILRSAKLKAKATENAKRFFLKILLDPQKTKFQLSYPMKLLLKKNNLLNPNQKSKRLTKTRISTKITSFYSKIHM